jgi:hypothetical protein
VQTSDVIATRVVVVDAIDDGAAEFYRRWGFIDAPGNPHRLIERSAHPTLVGSKRERVSAGSIAIGQLFRRRA